MKQCFYCGKENPDDSSHCSGCGTSLLAAPPQARSLRFFWPRENLIVRLLIAGGVFLAISGISLKVACRQSRSSVGWFNEEFAERQLRDMRSALDAYQNIYKTCPDNFEQLRRMTNYVSEGVRFFEDESLDPWGHPYIFSHQGADCMVISYGRDGKPGGIGVDCDLSAKNLSPKEAIPTFEQFWHNEKMQGMILWCFISGAFAGILSLLTVRVPNLAPRGLILLGLSLGITVAAAVFIASVITALHVPSGHYAMRFRYLKDPLFLFCLTLYFVNRWIFKRYFPNEFFRGYLNDVICIPFWVPIMLLFMRAVRLRASDEPPTGSEILIPLILWSWVFEVYLPFVPFFKHLATSDYRDIMSYTVGALVAALFWKMWYHQKSIER